MEKVIKGLVIREVEYRESDKILTLLTESGKLTVTARGAKKPTGKNLSLTSLFCYSEFTLNEQNGKLYLSGGSLIESFYSLREDILRLALASAFVEIAGYLGENPEDAAFMLKLTLNSLYFLSRGEVKEDLIKSVFEAKCAEFSGFFPDFSGCDYCGAVTEKMYFDADSCEMTCSSHTEDARYKIPINLNVLQALRFIGESSLAKAYKFDMSETDLRTLTQVTEGILCAQLGRRFDSLDYYKKLRI